MARTRTNPAERELKDLLAELQTTGIDIAAMSPVMNTEQVAALLKMSVAALEQARYRGLGIPFVKVGARVRYLRMDVARWLLANRKPVDGEAMNTRPNPAVSQPDRDVLDGIGLADGASRNGRPGARRRTPSRS